MGSSSVPKSSLTHRHANTHHTCKVESQASTCVNFDTIVNPSQCTTICDLKFSHYLHDSFPNYTTLSKEVASGSPHRLKEVMYNTLEECHFFDSQVSNAST